MSHDPRWGEPSPTPPNEQFPSQMNHAQQYPEHQQNYGQYGYGQGAYDQAQFSQDGYQQDQYQQPVSPDYPQQWSNSPTGPTQPYVEQYSGQPSTYYDSYAQQYHESYQNYQNPYSNPTIAQQYAQDPLAPSFIGSQVGNASNYGQHNVLGANWAQPAPQYYQPAPEYTYQQPVQAVWTPQQHARASNARIGVILLLSITFAVAGLAFLIFVMPNLLAATGGSFAGIMVGFFLSLFPLSAVLLSVYVIDRWEPEPKWMLLFALFWGTAGSIATTLIVQPWYIRAFMPRGLSSAAEQQQWLASFEAPPVEELSKGIGILLIALFARRYFDGPLDGVVYGATIGAGFAFTENIQYFGRAFFQSTGSFAEVGLLFVVRGIFSPFNHALFTACTGVAVGFGARKKGVGPIIGLFFVGLIPAMFLHFIWNTANFAKYFDINTRSELLVALFVQSAVIEIPLIAGWLIFIYFLRKGEAKLTHLRLAEYAANGWFTPEEVNMVATPRGRRNAMAWSRRTGKSALMRSFIRKSTSLAYTRQRIVSGSQVQANQREELTLLDAISRIRPIMAG